MVLTLLSTTFVYALILLVTGLVIAEGVTYREYKATRKRRQRIVAIVQAELEETRKN